MMRWLLLLCLLLPTPAHAGDGFDVKAWLSRPGVKVLAVEFYATWCKPCMEAVPRWKRLHEKYRDQGFRLVVVSVQDPDGTCVNPGWNPDDIICDDQGHLSEAMKVGNNLPAAFLWSWRGNLLVRRGHVDDVARAVEAELSRLPRVTLDEGMDKDVRVLLRAEMSQVGKVTILADRAEREALAKIRKESHELGFSDRTTCKVGEQLAANSLLKATRSQSGGRDRLTLQLFSAETGCLNGSASVGWIPSHPEGSVAEAVAELMNGLRSAPMLPSGIAPDDIQAREIGEAPEAWEMNEDIQGVIIAIQSEPAGAVVLLDDKLLCPRTPCSKLVPTGYHRLEMHLESHLSVTESIQVTSDTKLIKRELTPDYGWLTVQSEPSGLSVSLDGKPWGTTPIVKRQVPAGPHRVLVTDPGHYDKGREFTLRRSEHQTIDVKLEPRLGGLRIDVNDRKGNDLPAAIILDGRQIGQAPFSGKVQVGEYVVRILHGGEQSETTVVIAEKEIVQIHKELFGFEENIPGLYGDSSYTEASQTNRTAAISFWPNENLETAMRGAYASAIDKLVKEVSSQRNIDNIKPDPASVKNPFGLAKFKIKVSTTGWWLKPNANEVYAQVEMLDRKVIPARGEAEALAGIVPLNRVSSDEALGWSIVATDNGDGFERGRARTAAIVRALAYAIQEMAASGNGIKVMGVEDVSVQQGSSSRYVEMIFRCLHKSKLSAGLEVLGVIDLSLNSKTTPGGETTTIRTTEEILKVVCCENKDCCEVLLKDQRIEEPSTGNPEEALGCLLGGLSRAGIKHAYRYMTLPVHSTEACVVGLWK